MCEYYPYDDSAEIAMKISEENWEIDNKFLLIILTVATKQLLKFQSRRNLQR